jgi:hypothetical protein
VFIIGINYDKNHGVGSPEERKRATTLAEQVISQELTGSATAKSSFDMTAVRTDSVDGYPTYTAAGYTYLNNSKVVWSMTIILKEGDYYSYGNVVWNILD